MSRLRATLLAVLLVLLLAPVAVLASGAAGTRTNGAPDERDTRAARGTSPDGPSGAADPREAPVVTPERATADSPTRVRIPSLGVDSALEDLRTDRRGKLEAPKDWQRAGWFTEGTRPGAAGPAVVAGHVDSPDGPAVFARLDELRVGDVVEVDRGDADTVRFVVDRTQVAPKDDFPTEAVYGPTPDPQLRLITCDGPYVESSDGYQDNLVVFASEVAA